MELKRYQKNTLEALGRYFGLCRTLSPADAYARATEDDESLERLGAQRGYTPFVATLPDGTRLDVPVVTTKVPTGGGKTILAAHAVKTIAEANGQDYPFVLWFAPSDTIRRQTAEALKKPGHPYRAALDEAFKGRVRVFDLDEKFQIRPGDVAQNACILVATEQAFVKRDVAKYKVYADNEELEPHFAAIALAPGMEPREDAPDKPKCSLSNLLFALRPIVVVDEAHKMTSDLSLETLARLRPRAVLGLSATPEARNNTVYSVWATELFDEEMVKLPVELTEFRDDWTQAVFAALAKRKELEELAARETAERRAPFLRPIVLFQATNVRGEVPPDELRRFLVEEAKVPPEAVRTVTAEQKELDGVDVRDPACPVTCVITVQALKEGWDCPSAYVLCSVANVQSGTDTVQLLGRVMRQPDAKRRKTPALNRAYAFVRSERFGAAASELAEGLRKKGFEAGEAARAIELRQTALPGMGEDGSLFGRTDAVFLDKTEADAVAAALPDTIRVEHHADGTANIAVSVNISEETIEQAADAIRQVAEKRAKAGDAAGAESLRAKAAELRAKGAEQRKRAGADAPCKRQTFALPKLAAEIQGELVFTAEDAYDALEGGIEKFLSDRITEDEFRLEPVGAGFTLFLDGNEIKASSAGTASVLQGISEEIAEGDVLNKLDEMTPFAGLSQVAKRKWIGELVRRLVGVDGYKPDQLFAYRHSLKRILEGHLTHAADEARRQAYQQTFRLENPDLSLRFDDANSFLFDEHLYESVREVIPKYSGPYQFSKHFLGSYTIPAFDGKKPNGEGEEFECAQIIDGHPAVKTWLRNLANNDQSFRLPISSQWFYPDFVGELHDGRLFVVEYKGDLLRGNSETLEKDAIGRLWADKSHGKCLYATVYKEDRGVDVAGQIDRLFRSEAT